jgi:hypothetical protein
MRRQGIGAVPCGPRRGVMPLFMDVHNVDGGVSIDDVAKAHLADAASECTGKPMG